MLLLAALAAAAALAGDAAPPPPPQRTPLLSAQLPAARSLDHVQVVQIKLAPGQRVAPHRHPIPVVGYVVQGEILFTRGGAPGQVLKAGDAFYEPADELIATFDNLSAGTAAEFVAFYLLGPGQTELIRPER